MQHGLRDTLHTIVFGTETPMGFAFDVLLLLLILASVMSTMLETVKSVHAVHARSFWIAERVFTGIFVAEYVLRVAVAKPGPRAYICSFFGSVDLLAILPTLLVYVGAFGASSMHLRIVRVLRLLRVFRVLQSAGLQEEAEALRAAFLHARRKILVFLIAILVVVTVMGTAVYILEDARAGFTSIPRSIYWAIVTVTTVGYGDIAPQSVPGQALASMMMVAGYSMLAVPTGIAAAEYSLASSRRPSTVGRQQPRAGRLAPLAAASGGKRAAVVPTRACDACQAVGHDADAHYCKHCGEPLDYLGSLPTHSTA